MNNELLPCPFCGSTEIRAAKRGLAYAECRKCDAYGPSQIDGFGSDRWRTANNMWNQRATAQPRYREPALEDALELIRANAERAPIEQLGTARNSVLQALKQLGFVRKVQP